MRKNFGAKPLFYPLPVLIVATYGEDGSADAMNAAWGGLYDSDKVVLCLSEGHKTTKNIKSKKAFTVSFADEKNVIASDYVGLASGNTEPNKLEKAGFTTVKSEFVDAPVINELPVTMECVLEKITEDGNIIGKVVNLSVDESVLSGEKIDMKKFRPIAFEPSGNKYHVLGEEVGNAFSDGKKLF